MNKEQLVGFTTYDEKEEYVQDVFSSIAKHYDIMNTVLSFGQDRYWRKFAIEQLQLAPYMKVLDVACGTGMLTKVALSKEDTLKVEGLDFNAHMLAEGKERLKKAGLLDRVHLVQGDAMDLPYEENTFHCAMSAFALRNVPSITQTLAEMKRVVKPGGRVVTLELGKPTVFGFKQLYYLYFEKILPLLGRLSRDNSSYGWLPESLKRYPHQEVIKDLFEKVGFEDVSYYELTGGIVCVHVGTVPRT